MMKTLWFSVLLIACVDLGGTQGFPKGPADSNCDDGQVWNDFYESCVNTCPSGQSYDRDGICANWLLTLSTATPLVETIINVGSPTVACFAPATPSEPRA